MGKLNFTREIARTSLHSNFTFALAKTSPTEKRGHYGIDPVLFSGDKISGCYLRGSIDGQTVRVVSVVVTTD